MTHLSPPSRAEGKELVGPVYLELEYHDMLGILRCLHQELQVTDPAAVMILTDRELVKLYADSWGRDFDDDEPTPEERLATPRVLVIWCGELRDGPKASCEMLLDTLRIRRSRGKITWLGRDPKERFWFGEQAGYADVVTFLKRQFAHLATPRLVAPPVHPNDDKTFGAHARPAPAKTGSRATASPAPTRAPTASKSPRTQVAKFASTCINCGGGIPAGSSFVWADLNKNKSHPNCMSAREPAAAE